MWDVQESLGVLQVVSVNFTFKLTLAISRIPFLKTKMSLFIRACTRTTALKRSLVQTRYICSGNVKYQAHGRASPQAAEVEDLYPTRSGSCEVLPRPDPVVWTHEGVSPTGPLTTEQLNHYRHRGYLVIDDVFTPEELKPIQDEVFQLRDEIESGIGDDEDPTLTQENMFLTEPSTKKLRGIFAPHMHHRTVQRLSRSDKLVSRARQIVADEVYIHQSRINFHQALVGTGHVWHTDFEIFHAEDGMPRLRGLNIVVMLGINTPQQGSLLVVPESHKVFIPTPHTTSKDSLETNSKFRLKVQYGVPDEAVLTDLVQKHGIEYCTGRAGSIIMFDLNLVHANQNNLSTLDRTNIFMVYNSVNNKLVKPFGAPWDRRPEHMGAREAKWVQPIKPIANLLECED